MIRSRKTALSLLLLLILTATGIYWGQKNKAPALELVSVEGQRISLEALRGHPVLVSFWASDCRSCLEEIPELVSLHEQYAQRGLKLLAIAMPYDPPSRVLNLAKDWHLPYSVILDPLGQAVAAFGQVNLIPHHFLIDAKGIIRQDMLGKITLESFRPSLEKLLEEH